MSRVLTSEIVKSIIIVVAALGVGHFAIACINLALTRLRVTRSAYVILSNTVWLIVGWIALLSVLSTLGLRGAFDLSAIGLAVIVFLIQGFVTSIAQGFIIVAEHSFDVGDHVYVDGTAGTVTDIGLRLTTLRGEDGRTVTIPNSTLYSSNIVIGEPERDDGTDRDKIS